MANKSTGPEDIDAPIKRHRSAGRINNGPTRADAVAFAMAKAGTIREMGAIAARLGTPPALVDAILAGEWRNSIKAMKLSNMARHWYRKKQEKLLAARQRVRASRVASRVFRLPPATH